MLATVAAARRFLPSRIAGLQLWLDASVESSLGNTSTGVGGATNNGPVKYWADLSGNAVNASSSAADSAVPTLLSGSQNGLSVLRFDGGDRLDTASFAMFPSKRGTAFVALNNRKSSGYGTIASTYNNGGTMWQWYIVTSGTNFAWWDGPKISYKTNYDSQAWHIMAVNRTGDTAMDYWQDGSSTALTLTNNQPSAGSVHIAATTAGEYATIDIGEVLFYNRSLSSDEMGFVRRYLANKWGVTL